MRHRILSVLTALVMTIVGTFAVAPGAHAATIMIDDYAATVLGTRSTSTVGSGNFTQAGGLGVFTAQGTGNTAGSATINYAIPTRDLTDSGLNKQFFLEFTDINRTNRPNVWDTAANISISVTGGGTTGYYSTAISNTDGPHNIVFNMDCNLSGGVCFTPMPNFTSVTAISVTVAYPNNYDSTGGVLTAKLEQIRTTPLGGGAPPAPSVSVSQPSGNPVYVKQGDTLTFPVTVSLGQGATLVNGLASNEVSLSGTAGGTISSLTGSGTANTVIVGGISASGTVKVNVAAGAIVDSWDQVNAASSSNSVNVVYVVPPVFQPPSNFTLIKGQAFTGNINVQSADPSVTYSITSGSLPTGVTLNTSTGALTGTPTASGTFSLQIKATNIAGSATASFSIQVNEVPAITSTNTASFMAGQTGSFSVTATGIPQSSITIGSLPAGLSVAAQSGSTRVISGTPTIPGSTVVSVDATNSAGSVHQDLTVNVNQLPIFSAAPTSQSLLVDQAVAVDLPFTAFPAPSASLASGSLPAGLSLSIVGGVARISGTPSLAAAGTHTFTVRLSNAHGSADHTLTLNIGSPAAITSANTSTVTAGQPVNIAVTASGVPTPAITVTGLPTGLTWTDNGTGTGDITGSVAATGTYSATVTAANSSGPNATQNLTIRVVQGPAITSAAAATMTQGTAASFAVITTGYPAAAITRTGTLPSGMSFIDNGDGTATISGTPTQFGVFPLTIIAKNSDFPAVTQVLTITVHGAPVLAATPDRTGTTGTIQSFNLSASGLPVPALTVAGLPSGLSSTDNGDGTITVSGTPTASAGGVYTVTVTAVNSAGTTNRDFTLTISQAPNLTSAASTTLIRGTAGAFELTSTGYPAANIAVTGTLPSGLTLGTSAHGKRTISGTPTQHGVFPLTITATNGVGISATQTFTLRVEGAPTFYVTPDRVAQTGVPSQFAVTADALPVATITATGLPSGLAASQENGTLTISGTPAAGAGGSYPIQVTAANSLGSVNTSFTLTVNQPSAITSGAAVTFTRGVAASHVITSTGFPAATPTTNSELPAGLTLTPGTTPGTAVLAGTPSVDGDFTVNVVVDNSIGGAAQQSLTVRINGEPPVTGSVTIHGTGIAGSPLTADSTLTSSVNGADLTGHWVRDGLVIPDADESTWTPSNADAGALISYEVSVTAPGYVDLTVPATNQVTVEGVISATLDVAGTPRVDEQLVADLSGLTPADSDVQFTWRVGADVVATEASYTPSPSDIGSVLSITAKATKNDFGDLTLTTTLDPVVEAVFDQGPTVNWTGTAQVGQDLSAVVEDSAPASQHQELQWYADGVEIPGATDEVITLTPALKGKRISARVTVSRAGYMDASTTSSETAPVATNLAPTVTLKSSTTSLRRGGQASVTWTTQDATTVAAGGAWRGTIAASGVATVTPAALGSNVYTVTATNHIGTTTAQVAIAVRRPKATLKVTFPKGKHRVGTKIRVKVAALDPGEAFKVRIGGHVVGKGHANATGHATVTVRIPKKRANGSTMIHRSHVKVFGEENDRKGIVKLKVTRKKPLSDRKLKLSLASKRVRASDPQTIKVRGLGKREPITVIINGERVSKPGARANAKGRYTIKIKNVGTAWGTRVVTVKARKSSRTKSVQFIVIPRWS